MASAYIIPLLAKKRASALLVSDKKRNENGEKIERKRTRILKSERGDKE